MLAPEVVVDNPIPPTEGVVLVPETGPQSESAGGATIDYSNADDGYVIASYGGDNPKVKLMIEKGDTTYKFDLKTTGVDEVFPLTMGDGVYKIGVYENVSGTKYAMALNTSVTVALTDPLTPYLYPNQYVNFDAGSAAVAKARELAAGAPSHLDVVANIYNYVVENVSYDTEKADTVQQGYLPVVDETLASGKGICFDFAALMSAMLRSQNIPTRLEVGYVSGGVYHAWISVYTPETGWIDNIIQFDGANWAMMDPTFASSAGSNKDLVGDGTGYSLMYQY
jgi:transglutaminase-like putative cysteine protease